MEEPAEEDRILDFERIFSSECADNTTAVNTSQDAFEECPEESLAITESAGQG